MGKANRNRKNKKKDSKNHDGNESKTTGESSSERAEAKTDGKKVSQISTEGNQAAAHSPRVAAEEIKDKEDRSTDTTKEQNSDSKDLNISEELLKSVEGIWGGVLNECNQELKAKFTKGEISALEFETGLLSVIVDNLSNEYYKSEYLKVSETMDKDEIFKTEKKKLQKFANTLSNKNSKANFHQNLRKLSEEFGNCENKIEAVELSTYNKVFGLVQDRSGNAREIDGATSGDGTQKETSTSQTLTEGIKSQKYSNESTGSSECIQPAGQSAQNERENKNEEKRSKKDTDVQDIQSKSKMEKLAQEFKDCRVQEKNISEASHSSENDDPKSLKKTKKDRDEFQRDMKKFMANQIFRLNRQETQKETSTSQTLTEGIKGQKCGSESTGSIERIQPAGQFAQNESEDKNEENRSKKDTDDQDIQFQSEMEELAHKFKDCRMQEKNISEASHSSEKDKPKSLKKTKKDHDEFQRDMKKFVENQIFSLNKEATHEDREEALKAMKKQWDEGAVGFSEKAASDVEKIEEERKDSEEEIRNVTTEKDSKSAADDDLKEKIIQMKKGDYIHFEYDNDGDRHIFTREHYYFNYEQENQRILFSFNGETIQVLFTTDRIFVSTPNSEFSFLIRRYRPVDSTEKATQTDINQ